MPTLNSKDKAYWEKLIRTIEGIELSGNDESTAAKLGALTAATSLFSDPKARDKMMKRIDAISMAYRKNEAQSEEERKKGTAKLLESIRDIEKSLVQTLRIAGSGVAPQGAAGKPKKTASQLKIETEHLKATLQMQILAEALNANPSKSASLQAAMLATKEAVKELREGNAKALEQMEDLAELIGDDLGEDVAERIESSFDRLERNLEGLREKQANAQSTLDNMQEKLRKDLKSFAKDTSMRLLDRAGLGAFNLGNVVRAGTSVYRGYKKVQDYRSLRREALGLNIKNATTSVIEGDDASKKRMKLDATALNEAKEAKALQKIADALNSKPANPAGGAKLSALKDWGAKLVGKSGMQGMAKTVGKMGMRFAASMSKSAKGALASLGDTLGFLGKGFSSVLGMFGKAAALVALPELAVIGTAIAAIAGIGYLLYDNWETIKKKLKEFEGWAQDKADKLKEKTKDVPFINSITSWISDDLKDPAASGKRFTDGVLNLGKDSWKAMQAQDAKALQIGKDALAGASNIGSKVGSAVSSSVASVSSSASAVGAKVSQGAANLGTAAGNAVGSAYSAAGTAYHSASEFVGNLFTKKDSSVNIDGLKPGVKRNFLSMIQEYKGLGGKKKVQVNSAFRSHEQQAAEYAKDPKKAARPGTSAHEFGYAIDIDTPAANDMASMGLLDKYGFNRPAYTKAGKHETWHIQAKGTAGPLAKAGVNSADNPGSTSSNTRPVDSTPSVPVVKEKGTTVQSTASGTSAGGTSSGPKQAQGTPPASVDTVPQFSFMDPQLFAYNLGVMAA